MVKKQPPNGKKSAADLRANITDRIKRLAELTDQAAISEQIQAYLETCGKFHRYSFNNIMLIAFQNPNATMVAGYKRWLELNRYVRRGEKGIAILAPCIYKTNPNDENSPTEVKGFRVVYVFDISQTNGEPLPKPPEWTSSERQAELEQALIDFSRAQEITFTRAPLEGETQGVSKGGEIILSPDAGVKTLIHELAHELLHKNGFANITLDRRIKELEAEAVAFVVGEHFSLTDLTSPNYLALWEADSEAILARLDRIRTTAAQIIEAVI